MESSSQLTARRASRRASKGKENSKKLRPSTRRYSRRRAQRNRMKQIRAMKEQQCTAAENAPPPSSTPQEKTCDRNDENFVAVPHFVEIKMEIEDDFEERTEGDE